MFLREQASRGEVGLQLLDVERNDPFQRRRSEHDVERARQVVGDDESEPLGPEPLGDGQVGVGRGEVARGVIVEENLTGREVADGCEDGRGVSSRDHARIHQLPALRDGDEEADLVAARGGDLQADA